ncbi:MAG: UDP-N-acetylmuramoyl-tripeptide--D-alanyl-D-alanine ligase [Candidatus Peregrinibacteria bacterium]
MLALLTLAASLSPLLTLSALWQMKEWRLDRLREHLREEGIVRQMVGVVRILVLLPFTVGHLLSQAIPLSLWPIDALVALACVNLAQILLRRQPQPVWTLKAIVIVITTGLITLILGLVIPPRFLPLIPLLQILPMSAAWILWKPADTLLKHRVMERAKQIRLARENLTVIGITGSVGKSTTKELLAHILKEKNVLSTPAHVNTEMGVSQWLARELPRHEATQVLIVEMGAYRTGEIALLCSIIRPTLGIITFIGHQHIGLFGSQEALVQAKSELVLSLPADGHAFINADCALCERAKNVAPCAVTTIGTGGPADLEAFDIEEMPAGIRFRTEDTVFTVPLHGTHNITNVLLAIAVARFLGLALDEIAMRLRSFAPPRKTFTVREERNTTILDDTHNASPMSFEAAIQWARTQPFEEKTLLTSGLIELGEEQERIHADLGAQARTIFQRVIFVHPRSALSFAEGLGRPVEILDRKTRKAPAGSLVVCIGRMSEDTIRRLLPT